MYAVIKSGGKQHKVQEGDLINVELLVQEPGENIDITDVLMVVDGETVKVGTPVVEGASVSAEVVDQFRSKKLVVFKMKRRKGYRRKKGHRQSLTKVKITDIKA